MKDYALKGGPEHDGLNAWHQTALRAFVWRGKRVLDVGTGPGAFLEEVRSRGAQVCGIDPNPHHAPLLQERGIPHRVGYLDDTFTEPQDIVTCFEVIEHIYDPNPLVAAARRILTPTAGTLVLSTPNAFNIARALKFVLQQRHHDPLQDPVLSADGAEHVRAYSFGMVRDLFLAHRFSNVRVLEPRTFGRYLSHGIVMSGEAI